MVWWYRMPATVGAPAGKVGGRVWATGGRADVPPLLCPLVARLLSQEGQDNASVSPQGRVVTAGRSWELNQVAEVTD